MRENGPVAGSGCSRIAAGVERTLAQGSAEVEIVHEYDFPGEADDFPMPAAMSLRYRGAVDFHSDRASLASGDTSLVLDGEVTYQSKPDGQWTHTRQAGPTGQWNIIHPRWALEVLRQGCRSAEPDSRSDVAVQLDRDRVARLTGLHSDWQVRATAVFDDAGRLGRIEISLAGSARPDAWMRIAVKFIRFDGGAAQIDVPVNSVDLTGYLGLDSSGP